MDQTLSPEPTFKIGDVAERAGVSVDAIRFYERAGLVTPVTRTASGYRLYDAHATQRVLDLKTLQAVGLTLEEIAAIFAQAGDAPVSCAHVSPHFDTVIDRLNAKIASLTQLRDGTLAQAGRCRDGQCGRAHQH